MDETRQLVIAGGGPAAIEAALAVQRLAQDRVEVTLLSASDAFVYLNAHPELQLQPASH